MNNFITMNKIELNSSQIGYSSRNIKLAVESKSSKTVVEIPKVQKK